jgi:hypothetical protein
MRPIKTIKIARTVMKKEVAVSLMQDAFCLRKPGKICDKPRSLEAASFLNLSRYSSMRQVQKFPGVKSLVFDLKLWLQYLKLVTLSASVARSIRPRRSLSTKRVRHQSLPKVRDVTTGNNPVSEVKLSQYSRRKLRPPRKSCLNWNALNANARPCSQSKDANTSSS